MFKRALVAVIIPAALLMGACSAAGTDAGVAGAPPSQSESTTSEMPTPTIAGPQSFDTVVAFKDAIVAAGYVCDPWEEDPDTEKGTCNADADVLAVYADAAALNAFVLEYKADSDKTYPIIYGGNWLIMVESAADLASVTAKMYGTAYTPPPPPEPVVTIECYDLDEGDLSYEITDLAKAEEQFARAWKYKDNDCKATREDVALTPREKKALKASRYDEDDNGTADLYAMCAENEKDDYYSDKSNSPNSGQAAELKGWLVLCPNHPNAKTWKAAIKRGEVEQKLEKSGRSFYAGTYRVGKEIKPGTYAIKGDIENCYWERQDRNGEIIDNNLILSAKRVQVTIRSSDYAFSSEGCGNWRPAN